MPQLLPGQLPKPPREYNQAQFNQLVRALQIALNKNVESEHNAEDREALDFFLSN